MPLPLQNKIFFSFSGFFYMSNTEEEAAETKKEIYLGPVYHVCSDKIAAFSSFNQACKFVVWG